MLEDKIIGYDLDNDSVTDALMDLLNSYPDLGRDYIDFQRLDTGEGIAMFPSPNAAILSEKESVTGHVTQTCAYAFTIVFRTRTDDKENVKEWLDKLGRWLERQEIKIDGEPYKLESYPELSDGREFKAIKRMTQAALYSITDDKAEDWSISLQATYQNEFDR